MWSQRIAVVEPKIIDDPPVVARERVGLKHRRFNLTQVAAQLPWLGRQMNHLVPLNPRATRIVEGDSESKPGALVTSRNAGCLPVELVLAVRHEPQDAELDMLHDGTLLCAGNHMR